MITCKITNLHWFGMVEEDVFLLEKITFNDTLGQMYAKGSYVKINKLKGTM